MTDHRQVTPDPAEVVPNSGPDSVQNPPSGSVRRSKGGAPKGNYNFASNRKGISAQRARELATLARLTKGKLKAERDSLRGKVQRDGREILRELGLSTSPFAKRLVSRLVDVEVEIERLRVLCDGPHGRFTGEREPTRAYSLMLDLIRQDRTELRQILDQFAAGRGGEVKVPDAGLLQITIGAEPAVAIGPPGACATCGRQAPSGGDLPPGPTVPAPVEPDAVQRPVAPRTVEEVFRAEPVPVVVAPAESRRHRGFKGFAKDEIEDVPGDPGSIQW